MLFIIDCSVGGETGKPKAGKARNVLSAEESSSPGSGNEESRSTKRAATVIIIVFIYLLKSNMFW